MHDTIAAIATGPAPGPVGLIRISGPEAFSVAERVFAGAGFSAASAESHRIYYGHLRDPDMPGALDEVLLLTFRAPKSYTGEDVIEVCCHGGQYVLSRALAAVISAGARHAEPGEFTFRAFIHGRMDLAQAEAVAEIIHARSEKALRCALRQRQGFLSRQVGELRDRVLNACAAIEAHLEFDEEDAPPALEEVVRTIHELRDAVAAMLRSARVGRVVREGFRVAIVGRPNVGKSTLLNALVGRDRALVTPTAGTTRDVVSDTVSMGGISITLLDTAGLRQPRGNIERAGVQRTRETMAAAEGVLLVLDASRGWSDAETEVLRTAHAQTIAIALNKADRVSAAVQAKRLAETTCHAQGLPVAVISALTGQGLEVVEELIVRHALGPEGLADHPIVVQERHAEALRHADAALDRAASHLADSAEPVLAAEELRCAADHLGIITGITAPEDTVRRIFSRFCVGK